MMTGNQKPRINICPEYRHTDGKGAAMLMKEYGCELDQWQRDILDAWLGKDAAGDYVITSAGIAVPRQNGKNVIIEAREFYGLVVNGERILHTAHQNRTAKRSFFRLVNMFTDQDHPEVTKLVRQIRYAAGEESIELLNGGKIEFASRSRQAARGFDGISLIVYDEAQELTDDQVEALMATLSASATGQRQIIYAGTPPYPGCVGTVFKRLRSSCIAENAPEELERNSWHEWSPAVEKLEEININDESLWYETNPALGTRLTVEFTRQELKTLSPDGFARERLGWFAPDVKKASAVLAIDKDSWKACCSKEKKPDGKTAYGVKFNVTGSEVVLCGAAIPKDGPARISLIERRPTGLGLQWLADWLNKRYDRASCVVIDGKNGVDLLIDKIREQWKFKDSILRATTKDVINAASTLTNELSERTVTWYCGQEMLSESALSAEKRKIGRDGYGFGGPDPGPIEAAALALYGARTSKRDPTRKMRIG